MGLILDTSIFIQGERRDLQLAQILDRIQIAHPETSIAISAITIIELDHDIYRVPRPHGGTPSETYDLLRRHLS
jgi:predicted nucleic acid-binding protein